MRRILSALVGMAGLAAAAFIIVLAFNEQFLDMAVSFAVSGEIPGTHTQLSFASTILSGSVICIVGLGIALYSRYLLNIEVARFHANGGSADEPAEPFDGEDFIMVAEDIFDELIGGHQSLPVQLQLF